MPEVAEGAVVPVDRVAKRRRRIKWRQLHPEQWREEKRQYMRRHYEKVCLAQGKEPKPYKPRIHGTINLESSTIQKHGITRDEFDTLYARQQGKCAICLTLLKRPWNKPTKDGKLHIVAIDHNHQTGTVRGLLCRNCNLGLGSFRDDLWRLKNAISYLEESLNLEKLSPSPE